MDEILNRETLRDDIRNQFIQNFSKELIDENQQQIELQIEKVVTFLISFSENKYFAYLASRKTNVSIEQHISNLPDGISQFENWFNSGLLDFAKDIFSSLTETMNSNIHFARLLDNRNYDEFIINSKTKDTDIEQWKSLLEPLFQLFDTPYLVQASACINLSLDNAALSLLHLWLQSLWFDDKSIQRVFDDAKAIVAIRNEHASAGKKGALKRWSPRDATRFYAIKLFEDGCFKNPNQAADKIIDDVIKYGISVNYIFSSNFQAQRTTYNWLLAYNKKK